MSIKRYKNTYVPCCDICGRELRPERDFYAAVNATRDAGWFYDKETQENLCEECRPEDEEELL